MFCLSRNSARWKLNTIGSYFKFVKRGYEIIFMKKKNQMN